jgi:hypothetical protein
VARPLVLDKTRHVFWEDTHERCSIPRCIRLLPKPAARCRCCSYARCDEHRGDTTEYKSTCQPPDGCSSCRFCRDGVTLVCAEMLRVLDCKPCPGCKAYLCPKARLRLDGCPHCGNLENSSSSSSSSDDDKSH